MILALADQTEHVLLLPVPSARSMAHRSSLCSLQVATGGRAPEVPEATQNRLPLYAQQQFLVQTDFEETSSIRVARHENCTVPFRAAAYGRGNKVYQFQEDSFRHLLAHHDVSHVGARFGWQIKSGPGRRPIFVEELLNISKQKRTLLHENHTSNYVARNFVIAFS